MNAPATTTMAPVVWIVDSAYTGELNARIGLAERLHHGYEIIPLPNGDFTGYCNALRQRYERRRHDGTPPLLLISGTGEETVAAIADLRAEFADRLINVYLASILPDPPPARLAEYDIVASPQITGPNVVPLVGVAHRLSRAVLDSAQRRHRAWFDGLAAPVIGVLLGGNTRYCQGFTPAHAAKLAHRIRRLAERSGGTLVITNSRRTPHDALHCLLDALGNVAWHFFDWRDSADFYPALLACADFFIVTGDSLSMCTEAAFTGKPVFIDLTASAMETYHRAILDKLIAHGAARPLHDAPEPFTPWYYPPLDPLQPIAQAVRAKLLAASSETEMAIAKKA